MIMSECISSTYTYRWIGLSCDLNNNKTLTVPIFQDVVSLLLAAGCPDLAPGGTLPRRRGSGQVTHGRSKEIASSVL